MFSLLVGLILLIFLLIAVWVIAGKLGAFDFIGNMLSKIKNFFKEGEK